MKDGKTKKLAVSRKEKSEAAKVWINPNSTFKDPRANRAWDHRQLAPPSVARLLELAEIALGAAKLSHPSVQKKKPAA